MNTNPEARYDVVIIACGDLKVNSIVGRNRKLSGHLSAESLEELMYQRCNEDYMPLIVPTGACKVGDTVPDAH